MKKILWYTLWIGSMALLLAGAGFGFVGEDLGRALGFGASGAILATVWLFYDAWDRPIP